MNRLGQRWIAILMVLGLGLTLLSHITTYGEATPMLGLGSDSNSFVYVDGDPINNTDPTGLTRKGLPRNPLELLPLESGGGPRFGGAFVWRAIAVHEQVRTSRAAMSSRPSKDT